MGDGAAAHDEVATFVDRLIIKLMYKPVGMLATVVAAMLSSMIFDRIWRALAGEKNAPEATDKRRAWADILPAAALHGVIFGLIKALADRVSATQFERVTGRWPGSQSAADSVSS